MAGAPVRLIQTKRFADDRGWFSEVSSDARLEALGIADQFVQDNQSLSRAPFTLRGLHFQVPPHAQAKLVRCIRGRVFDVAVDLRRGSPTFGAWTGAELTADGGEQMYIAAGFAHGFLTLEPDCELLYKVSSGYAPDADRSIRWDDPAIGIRWPLPAGVVPALSAKDRDAAGIGDSDWGFDFEDGVPLTPVAA